MMIKHRKTYTLEMEIKKNDPLYSMFREAHDKANTEPFLHIEEIGDIIERDVRPLVPFKRVYGWSYRLYVSGRDEVVNCCITYKLDSNIETDFIY